MSQDRSTAPPFGGFLVRVVTATFLGAATLAAIIWGRSLGLGVLVSLIAMLGVREFYSITRREHRLPNEVFGVLATGTMPIATALWGRLGLMSVVTGLVVLALLWHVAFRQVRTADTATTVFGAIYLGFLLSHFVLIRQLDSGTELALATIVSVWANDVFAYLVGSTVGRHKKAPRVSPNKSWEGFLAGTAFTVLVWTGVFFLIDSPVSLATHILVGVAVSFAAVVGDLAESRLKREAGIKDSGRLLPGHGGFL
ncbi:MAG: phosphatidate cytidylyltransferase, partial [Coriobacteriia bacterium]|nr:phosphatidate cytidylyltransferase [Coriobacteriia bacterium]